MPDREYKITVTAATQQATAEVKGAAQALQQTGEAAKKAGAGMQEAGKHAGFLGMKKRELKKLTRELAHEFPLAGMAAKAMLNPVVFAFTAAIGIFAKAKQSLDAWNEAMDKSAEEAAKPMTHALQAQREAVVALSVGMDALHEKIAQVAEGEKSLRGFLDELLAERKDYGAALAAEADAEKEAELATLDDLHERGIVSAKEYVELKLGIEREFRKRKRQEDEAAQAAELQIKREYVAEAQKQQLDLNMAAEGALFKKVNADAALAALPTDEELAEKKKSAKVEMEAFRKKRPQVAGVLEAGGDTLTVEQQRAALWNSGKFSQHESATQFDDWISEYNQLRNQESQARKEYAENTKTRSMRKKAADSAGREYDRAAKEAETNAGFIATESRDVSTKQRMFDARRQVGERTDAFQEVAGYRHALADAGKQVSELQKAAGEQMKASGHVSASVLKQITEFTNFLRAVEARLSQVESQTANQRLQR